MTFLGVAIAAGFWAVGRLTGVDILFLTTDSRADRRLLGGLTFSLV